MRAALLPTPGEPFMLAYWLRNFETWRDEVDALHVFVNGNDEYKVFQVPEHMQNGPIRWTVTGRPIGHGQALLYLLDNTEADEVVLCEDDAYVREGWVVGDTFNLIENDRTDIIGSPRYEDSVSQYAEWPPFTGVPEDLGAALWPAFLFARRADLLATDRGFEDRIFRLGEVVPGFGPVTPEMCAYVGVSSDYIHVDTFYATTYQLRSKRIELVHRTRVLEAEAAEAWIAYDPPWFHVSGLSAIWMVLAGQTTNLPDLPLWPRRVAWWERTYREADASLRDSSYGRTYRERLDWFRVKANIDAVQVEQWDARFEAWA